MPAAHMAQRIHPSRGFSSIHKYYKSPSTHAAIAIVQKEETTTYCSSCSEYPGSLRISCLSIVHLKCGCQRRTHIVISLTRQHTCARVTPCPVTNRFWPGIAEVILDHIQESWDSRIKRCLLDWSAGVSINDDGITCTRDGSASTTELKARSRRSTVSVHQK